MAATQRFRPNIQTGNRGLDVADLRRRAMNDPAEFAQKTQCLIDEGKLSWDKVSDVRNLFLALQDIEVPATFDMMGQKRAIMASAFPLLAGGMTVAGINAAYEAVPTIGQLLVTDREDNKRVSIRAAITSEDTQVDRVDEGKDFPEIGAGEEKYEIRSKRNGRRLSITAEMIEENDVAGIVQRVNALGEIANELIEEQTLRRVFDIDGSGTSPAEPYVLRPQGAGTSLYVTANTTLTRLHADGNRVTNNALADETDLENARARLVGVMNSRGRRVNIPLSQCKLVVPDALAPKALKILNSELVPGVENEVSNWGPRGSYRPTLISSPMIDALSTTAWYLGDFAKQFERKWKLRFEYVTLENRTETFLRNRIAFQARIAWDCEIGAVDYVYVVQNLTSTTAP